MIINRQKYLEKLISCRGNSLIKVVTGPRRCGKSYLLSTIFRSYLLESGVASNHIIEVARWKTFCIMSSRFEALK